MDQMDCSTSAAATPASTSPLQPPPSCIGRIAWPEAPSSNQYFSLPENIIYYMARNPKSPELYFKLAKSSKYFFEMLPLLIANRITVDKDGKRMCKNSFVECEKKKKKCCVKMDLGKITRSKIWLLDQLNLFSSNEIASMLIAKLYECKNAQLGCSSIKISLDEFKLWGNVFQEVVFFKDEVIDSDGSVVTVDSMLGAVTSVKEFCYWCDANPVNVTSATVKNILKLNNLDQLKLFHLRNVPEVVSVKDMPTFIKKFKDTKIEFLFHPYISDEYKRQLDSLVDDIITSKVPNCLIWYLGIDREKYKIMESNTHQ